MLRLVLKNSSSRAPIRALTSVSSLVYYHILPPTDDNFRHTGAAPIYSIAGKLEFRSTLSCNIGSAVRDSWCDEDTQTTKNLEEGLEINKLGISDEIVSALASRGITKLFPIQRAVLEPAMSGRDMYGRARTGTGKTLAFGIPILNKIIKFNQKHGKGKYPLALVLAPTRELAKQVEKEFHDSAPNLDTICVYGGTPIYRQISELNYGVDIVVGTPGRVIDLIKRNSLNLQEVQFVVIDEADQMLNVGFVDDVETIFQKLPQNRQSMLFSATMPTWIRSLIRKYLNNPLTIDLVGEDDQKLADGISLYSIASDTYSKASILVPLIQEHGKGGKCIVFTQTKRDADRLAGTLARKLKCEALHGDISQAVRERTLAGFRNGYFNVLVATDVAARGLDIPNVDLVVHYEIPNTAETFVHRSGRTGRAGKKGTAILIYTEDQGRQKKIFEREVGCTFKELPKITVDGSDMDMSGRFGGPRERFSRNDFGDRGSTRFRSDSGYGKFGRPKESDRFGGFLDYGNERSGRFGDSSKRSGFGDFESRKRFYHSFA